jgi:Protein of unknown function (DUF3237)
VALAEEINEPLGPVGVGFFRPTAVMPDVGPTGSLSPISENPQSGCAARNQALQQKILRGNQQMKILRIVQSVFALVIASLLQCMSVTAYGQSTEIKTEYLMTYVAPLAPPIPIDSSLVIVGVQPGGWVKGPKISGKLASPGGDWLRIMPSGALRLDVRGLIQTDDNAYIFISYNGIIQQSKESAERLGKGEVLTTKDIPYFVTAPTMQTSAEKYAWLNNVQLIAKFVEVKLGEGGYVKYDVFVVR